MASKIKVDQIEGQSGTTVTLPSGQTLDLSSGSVTLPNTSVTNAQLAGSIDLTTKVTGALPVTKGGTGLTSLGTAGQTIQVNSGANALEFAAPAAGKVKQIVYSEDSGQRSTTSSSYTKANNTLQLSITPTQSSAKIWVQFQFTGGGSDTSNRYFFTILRTTGGTGSDLGNGGNGIRTHEQGTSGYQTEDCIVVARKDEPNTTSAVTYDLQMKVQGGTGYIGTNGISSGIAIEYE